MRNLKRKIMKNVRKMKQKKSLEGFKAINSKNLLQIRGGSGDPIPRGSVL
ncbi:MAG: ComC/BlpC family leader-containing pheromone/bacteriocin [Bacteroidales bacterium]|nr:ComC/BlpC family leader-containing pheromone/bacteriocin [Bacteroidales bacterium]